MKKPSNRRKSSNRYKCIYKRRFTDFGVRRRRTLDFRGGGGDGEETPYTGEERLSKNQLAYSG